MTNGMSLYDYSGTIICPPCHSGHHTACPDLMMFEFQGETHMGACNCEACA